MTTCLLIRNPVARHALSDAALNAVLDVATAVGWSIESVATDRAGAATMLARDAAARGVDVVVVHGGDGTLNEAVNGLVGTQTALAVLRGGTANVWAKETQCAKNPVASMRDIITGVLRRVDIVRAGDRAYVLMAGIGLDAAILPRVGARTKRRFGALAYIIAGVVAAIRTKPWRARLIIDGEPLETALYWLLLGNTRSYGGVAQIAHRAVVDDGEMDLVLMRRGGVFHLVADGVRVLLKRHERSPNVLYRRARSVVIETPGIPVHVDGEEHGCTPMRFAVEPLALRVIVPASLRSPLFGADALRVVPLEK